jgi:hypothetical protein
MLNQHIRHNREEHRKVRLGIQGPYSTHSASMALEPGRQFSTNINGIDGAF